MMINISWIRWHIYNFVVCKYNDNKQSESEMRCERRVLCLMLYLKCAVSLVSIFLTNALRSHHLCGLEFSGFIYLKYEPHYRRLISERAVVA